MKKKLLFLLCALLLNSSLAFAVGGDGATCNPATANWPNCELAAVPAREHVINTVHIPGGHYSSPYIADQARTEYILQGDITADSTAITVSASYVVINLNGHTITYNETSPGEGVNVGAWNRQHIAVVNGSIIQGAAMSEGTSYGLGNNPVGNYNSDLNGYRPANYMHIVNLYVKYNGRDVAGIACAGDTGVLIEQNTAEDTFGFGTLKNRQHGFPAISSGPWSNDAVIRNNTVINARQSGINTAQGTQVYGNHISVNSIDTNSSGVTGGENNVSVYNNTIIGRGVHPIGIYIGSGAHNGEVYNNYIDLQVTRIGTEYGDSMFASGFRTTWGANNLHVYNNEIYINTAAEYSGHWAHTGEPVTHQSRGKGLFIGINPEQTALLYNNYIEFAGDGVAYGVSPAHQESDKLFIVANTIKTHDCHVVLEDSYSGTLGFPLFMGNHFIRTGNNPNYYTIGGKLGGYFDQTARFVDNIYSGGASAESINLHPSGRGIVSVYFGTVLNGEYRYNYRLHDNNGTSSTLLREDFNPPRTLNYAVPGEALEFLKPPTGLKVIFQ